MSTSRSLRGLLAGARALASQRWQGGGAGWGHLPLVAPASQQWNAGAKSCQPGTEASWRSAAFGAAAVGAAAGMAAMAASAEVPEGRDAARWSGLSGDLTLYQYEVCPFCCKAKAALDYFSVPYKVVEVNPVSKAQLKWSSTRLKVPVLVADGEVITESNEIMDRVVAAAAKEGVTGGRGAGREKGGRTWLGRGKTAGGPVPGDALAEEWRRWSDEKFVRVITVNIYRTWGEALQTFDYISRECHWGPFESAVVKYAGAVIMYFIAKRMISKYGLEGDVRGLLFGLSNEWTDAIGDKDFLGGTAPNVADLTVYGVLQAVRGTDTFTELMEVTRIKPWYMRMVKAMPKSTGKRINL